MEAFSPVTIRNYWPCRSNYFPGFALAVSAVLSQSVQPSQVHLSSSAPVVTPTVNSVEQQPLLTVETIQPPIDASEPITSCPAPEQAISSLPKDVPHLVQPSDSQATKCSLLHQLPLSAATPIPPHSQRPSSSALPGPAIHPSPNPFHSADPLSCSPIPSFHARQLTSQEVLHSLYHLRFAAFLLLLPWESCALPWEDLRPGVFLPYIHNHLPGTSRDQIYTLGSAGEHPSTRLHGISL